MIKPMGDLILLRHGQTEWSKAGKHTGRTDVPLTTVGAASAASLAPMLAKRQIVAVFTSPAARAIWTAELANLEGAGGGADALRGLRRGGSNRLFGYSGFLADGGADDD